MIRAIVDESLSGGDQTAPQPVADFHNYPNPFNPKTTFHFQLKQTARVQLKVYNARGQLVRTLADETLSAGERRIEWDGFDDDGKACASGVYLCRLQAASESRVTRAVLLK